MRYVLLKLLCHAKLYFSARLIYIYTVVNEIKKVKLLDYFQNIFSNIADKYTPHPTKKLRSTLFQLALYPNLYLYLLLFYLLTVISKTGRLYNF